MIVDVATARGRGRGVFHGGRGDFRNRGGRGGPPQAPPEVHKSKQAGVPEPSSNVQSLEDKSIQLSKELSLESLRLGLSLPQRPGYGTQGRPVILWANYFELLPPNSGNLRLYRYDVGFIPGIDGIPAGRKARWCVQLLLEQCLPQFGHNIVTDFRGTILSKIQLELNQEEFTVRYREEAEDEPRIGARTYKLRVQHTGVLELSDLLDFINLRNTDAANESKNVLIQALNIVLGHHLKSSTSVLSVGGNKHYPVSGALVEKWRLGAGLEAFRGFFVSVRAAASRILLNVQVKHIACYEAVPLATLMRNFPHSNNFYKLESFLKKRRVTLTHLIKRNKYGQEIPRIKTIIGFATRQDGRGSENPPVVPSFAAGADVLKFHFSRVSTGNAGEEPGDRKVSNRGGARRGGRGGQRGKKSGAPGDSQSGPPGAAIVGDYITVADYFRRNYRALENPELPVVNVGTHENPKYLPPEVCIVVPGQVYNTKLGSNETASMISFAVRRPNMNAASIITNGASLIGAGANPPLKAFGFSLGNELITVPARVLDSPKVDYRAGKSISTKFGGWNMQHIQFYQSSTVPTWSYLWISMKEYPDTWNRHVELIGRFHARLRASGINAPPPIAGLQRELDGGPHDETIIDATFDLIVGHSRKPQLMLVVLPFPDTAIYNRIKFMGDVRKGIHTICVVGTKFAKDTPDDNAQYLANVALKFNLKLGGVNQFLPGARLGIIGEGNTMVVGLDVTHPSPGSISTAPSIAGIVASVDSVLGQWPAEARIQTGHQEMIADLAEMFRSRLRLWQKKNKELPQNILVYRDGVSEGEYRRVLENELPEIRKACEGMYPASDTKKGLPKVSIIIVGKRHHTRFYPTKSNDTEKSGNPQNGTVVDRGVTEAANWDFFLQAHTCLHGTARPAHYFIIIDEIFRRQKIKTPFHSAADILEDLTHNMCYLFGRATKAVSICPPAYYAI